MYSLFGHLKLTGWLGLKLFWLRHAFAARGRLSIMLNTSFGGSNVYNDTGDSCKIGSCDKASDCREFVDCGEAGNCWEFGECGEPCGGETGGGGERGSRSTLKVKLSTILNKRWRQIHEIKQNRFFYEVFYSWFFAAFYRKELKVGSWVDGWVLPIRIKHFRDFLEIS